MNTFAGAALDRAAHRRTDDAWIAARVADPASRAVVIGPEGPWLDGDRPALVPLEAPREPVFLGVAPSGDARFAVAADEGGVGLRDAAARLSPADAGLVAYATAIVNWHRTHRYCARCGTATVMGEAGHVRRCPNCGAVHHPRTDPVVIMLVHDGDRVLLGRQARWPAGRYSTLAGFVEPGESLEEAVAREVAEEAGVEIGPPRYRSSQPWPFPASLMLGFHAAYAGGTARACDAELEDVRWFDRAEIAAMARGEGGGLHLPPPEAIARRLIDEWLEGP
ncbi:MAG: diphosphatase [Thermoleophilales bacterium]|nr:diphosphatase [Thermoleophilales bacterium]